MKRSVYIETSIVSYLTARPSNDIRAMANRNTTMEWWEDRKRDFELFVSEFVVVEASEGDPDAAGRRLASIDGIAKLEVSDAVRDLAEWLIAEGSVPRHAEMDAFHISVAAIHGMDYLLTWNCKHIANAAMRPKVEAVCRHHGYEPPVICTPQELMEE